MSCEVADVMVLEMVSNLPSVGSVMHNIDDRGSLIRFWGEAMERCLRSAEGIDEMYSKRCELCQ